MVSPRPGPGPGPGSGRRGALAAGGAVGVLALVAVIFVLAGSGGHRQSGATGTRSGAAPTGAAPASAPPAPPGPPAQPAPGAERFGASVNRLYNDFAYTPTQIDAQLAALRSAGATIARSDALWEAGEPGPPAGGVHHYDWRFDDQIAGSLAGQRLTWLPIVDYSPPWEQSIPGQDHSPPRSASDYAAFAGALAARYGHGGSFWRSHPELTPEPVDTYEIWNEPDVSVFWLPSPNASQYVELYLRARDAITAVDPGARVIIGGLAHPAMFLPAMLAARPDLLGHIDGVAIHPYGPTPRDVLAIVRSDRLALRSLGMAAVPLYVTEFGWTTLPPHAQKWAPERLRPRFIETSLATLGHSDCGIAAVLLYTWLTPERDPTNLEDWFGIHPLTGASNADTAAFAAGLREATQPAPTISVCGG